MRGQEAKPKLNARTLLRLEKFFAAQDLVLERWSEIVEKAVDQAVKGDKGAREWLTNNLMFDLKSNREIAGFAGIDELDLSPEGIRAEIRQALIEENIVSVDTIPDAPPPIPQVRE